MKECSKSIVRRLSDANFLNRYFVGVGVDIGGKPDPLELYKDFFPKVASIKTWDWEDGDAQFMHGIADETYDFVHSSHCLEHLVKPKEGLKTWLRVLKSGGHLIIAIPDEDLYEQGIFPSTFNRDHKWTFTIYKQSSWSEKSINVIDILKEIGQEAEIIKIEQLSPLYRFDLPRYDQSLAPIGEYGIEIIIRKKLPQDIADKGRWRRSEKQPDRNLRIHLNQYRDDVSTMKSGNNSKPPFENDNDL